MFHFIFHYILGRAAALSGDLICYGKRDVGPADYTAMGHLAWSGYGQGVPKCGGCNPACGELVGHGLLCFPTIPNTTVSVSEKAK